ncbi:hypothetical protein FRC12_023217 [Ceratobasidium sp. 428]|nr:hypothetical protein FRC12_023217 [Ceratobasidium sp. 428]
MYEPTRGGTRGGQAEFKWSDVSADKDRENYLGHSINAPTGRWQKNKDVHWYNRDLKSSEEERREEIRKIKEAEAEAMSVALGFKPSAKPGASSDVPATGANATAVPPKAPTSTSPPATQTEHEPSEKEKLIEREIEKAKRAVEKQAKRERKEQKRADKEMRRAAKGRERSRSRDRDERDRDHDRDERDRDRDDRERRREADRYRGRAPDSRDARRRSASPQSHDYKRRRESYSGPGPELSPTRSRSPYRRRYSDHRDRDREDWDDGYRRK